MKLKVPVTITAMVKTVVKRTQTREIMVMDQMVHNMVLCLIYLVSIVILVDMENHKMLINLDVEEINKMVSFPIH